MLVQVCLCVCVCVLESPEVVNRVCETAGKEVRENRKERLRQRADRNECDAAGSLEVMSAPPQHGFLMT